MSKYKLRILVLSLILASSTIFASEEALSGGWNQKFNATITSLINADLDADNTPEIIVGVDKAIYILNGSGNLKKHYPVNFTPSSFYAYDIDGDSTPELLIGSGAIKSEEFEQKKFNFTDKDDITLFPERLLRKTRHTGDIYLLDGEKPPTLFLQVGGWIRGMFIEDIDGDSTPEYVVAAGGLNIDYVEKAHLEDSKPRIVEHYTINTDYDYCSDLIKMLKDLFESTNVECAFVEGYNYMDVNISGGIIGQTQHKTIPSKDDQCDAVEDMIQSYYKNMSIECSFKYKPTKSGKVAYAGYLDVNYTQPPKTAKTWVFDTVEMASNNGSILIYSINKSLQTNISLPYIPYYVYPAEYGRNKTKAVAVGTEAINFIDTKGKTIKTFTYPEPNYSAKTLSMFPVKTEKANDLIVGFTTTKQAGVYVLDTDNRLIWIFRDYADDLRTLIIKDIDGDNTVDIVYASDKSVYVLGLDGNKKWSYTPKEGISQLIIANFSGKGYTDFVFASKKDIYCYQINEAFVKKQLAEKYYNDGKELSSVGKYAEALESLKKSRSYYAELSIESGILACDNLIKEVTQNLGGTRKETAAALYKKGLSELYLRKYLSAEEYLKKALEIYSSIGDEEGINNTRKALAEIEAESTADTTTTTATPTTTSTTNTNNKSDANTSWVLLFLAAIVVILLIITIIKQAGFKAKKEPAEEEK